MPQVSIVYNEFACLFRQLEHHLSKEKQAQINS